MTITQKLVAWSGCGVVMGVAFLHPWFWWLGIVSLVGMFALVKASNNYKEVFWLGWLSVLLKTLLLSSWVWSFRVEAVFAEVEAVPVFLLVSLVWLTASTLVSLPMALFLVSAVYLYRHGYQVLLLPAVLVLAELCSSVLFSLLMLDSSYSVNIKFTFGYLGYLLSHHNLLGQVAMWGGVYVLTVVFCLLAQVVFYFFAQKRNLNLLFILVAIVVTSVISFSAPVQNKTVFALQTNFLTPVIVSDKVASAKIDMQSAIANGVTQGADYILIPESINIFNEEQTDDLAQSFLQNLHKENLVMLYTESATLADDENFIVGKYMTSSGLQQQVYKNYLVPFGESRPVLFDGVIQSMATKRLSEYKTKELVYNDYLANPHILFCTESLDPFAVRKITNKIKVDFVAHLVSHGLFTPNRGLRNQMDMALKTQARFSGLPIIQASNYGQVKSYDSNGNELEGEVVFRSPEVLGLIYEF